MMPHRFGEFHVRLGLSEGLKMDIEHHQRTAIGGKLIQQPGMERTIPGAPAILVQFRVRLIVHQDEHNLGVGDGAPAEAEQIVVASVHPALTQRHLPQGQPAKNG
jgi:hypothetical protein